VIWLKLTQQTLADYYVKTLESYGVERVFGNPGSTEVPIMHALRSSSIQYILGLHEGPVMGMAGGYASIRRYRFHRDPSICPVGVAMVHSVPGLANAIGNLYATDMSNSPVILIAGYHSTNFQHKDSILSGDLVTMVDQFTKWSHQVIDPGAFPELLRRAFRVAMSPPTGPVFLAIPENFQLKTIASDSLPLGPIPGAGKGDPDDVHDAVDRIHDAENPVMVVGDHPSQSGGTQAVKRAVKFAEITGCIMVGEPYISEINFPTDHDLWVGFLSHHEHRTAELLETIQTDLIIFAGCSTALPHLGTHEEELFPANSKFIHINDEPWQVGKNVPVDSAILGSPGLVLEQLNRELEGTISSSTLKDRKETALETRKNRQNAVVDMYGHSDQPSGDQAISKIFLARCLYNTAPDALVVDESLSSKLALLNEWPLGAGQFFGNKGGGMGFGLPATIGAALAESEVEDPRNVIGFIGDGSYLFYPHALYSAARYDINCTIVIPDNRSYGVLKEVTKHVFDVEEGDYDFEDMEFDPAVDFESSSLAHGARCWTVSDPDQLESSLDTAIQHNGPAVVDVLVRD